MKIRGKERGFELNVQSHDEIEQICEGKDFANFGKLFEGITQGEMIRMDQRIAIILNKGFEDHRAFDHPGYAPEYLTEEDMKFLTLKEIQELEAELLLCVSTGQATTVDAEEPKPEKGTGKKSADGESLSE